MTSILKKVLLFVLAALFTLPIISCNQQSKQPDYAIGYSLEKAGISAQFPTDLLQPSPPYREDAVPQLSFSLKTCSSAQHLPDALLNYGHLDLFGNVTELSLSWEEAYPELMLPIGLEAPLGIYQAYRKSDLDAGKIIQLTLYHELPYRAEADPAETEAIFTLKIDQENVRDSSYLVAETEDYYIFDWLPFIAGDDIHQYALRCLSYGQYFNDSSEISFAAYLHSVPQIRPLTRQAVFTQIQ